MPIIVVNEAEGEVVIFRREAEGVFGEEVTVGDAGGVEGTGDGAEGGVVVVGGDAVLGGVVEDLGNILVAVVGVEEVEIPVLGAHDERTRGDGLGGIPHKLRPHGIALRRGHRHNAKRQTPCIDRHLTLPFALMELVYTIHCHPVKPVASILSGAHFVIIKSRFCSERSASMG